MTTVLDYVCPFSKIMFDTVYNDVYPIVKSKYPSKVQFIFRQQIQPWHPSSTLVHEAGVAVLQTSPDRFWDFSKALFDKQTEYFDANVVNEPRNKTYERLSKLAGGAGLDEKKIYSLLEISDKPDSDGGLNAGNKVTNDIKLLVKANRLQGIHVTPTVLFNVSIDQ
jgi:protein-disulfide isomerase